MKRGFVALGPWQDRAISGLRCLTPRAPSGPEKPEIFKGTRERWPSGAIPGEGTWSQVPKEGGDFLG